MRFLVLLLVLTAPASAQPLAEAAARSLAARFPGEAAGLEVRVERAPDAVLALDAPVVVWPADAGVPRGRVQVRVQTPHGDGMGVAMLFVAHFDTVAVAVRDLTRDAPVDAADVVLDRRETTRLAGGFLGARDWRRLAAAESFATRHVGAGTVLRPGDVRGPFAAEPGSPVALHYRRGDVHLVLRAQAREAGHVGDAVRLYAADTRTTYRARLVAPGEAEWLETL